MINNWPPELKSQGASYDRNKKVHLKLLLDPGVHAMFAYRKGQGMFKEYS